LRKVAVGGRRYFTEAELTKLISAARKGRYGHRDATLILIMARHGLRVSEAIDLDWDQIDFARAHLHVRRLKGGIASAHPIQGDELRALRELRRQTEGAFVFGSERGGPMTRSNVSKMVCCGTPAGICWPMRGTHATAAAMAWPRRY
jgi:type 1 fimbriae regulatory protein FimB/type 1 fimbriae regulatory protein FimE